MAGTLSDYAELKLLDHVRGKTAYTMPAVVAIALCTSAPTDASTGATIAEVTGTGYARKTVAAADLTAASSGSGTNTNALTFATATGDWSAPVTHYAVCDSATIGAGNMLWWASLDDTRTVLNGDIVSFAAGTFTLTLD